MNLRISKEGGRILTCTKKEKVCYYCKDKEQPLYFSEDRCVLVCMGCQDYVRGKDIESIFIKIDTWEINKDANDIKKHG